MPPYPQRSSCNYLGPLLALAAGVAVAALAVVAWTRAGKLPLLASAPLAGLDGEVFEVGVGLLVAAPPVARDPPLAAGIFELERLVWETKKA